MDSAAGGEEDEEQVDYGEDSGEESSMSLNGQARSTTWRRMLGFRGLGRLARPGVQASESPPPVGARCPA